MQRGFQTEIQRALLLAAGFLVFGYMVGYPLVALLFGGITYLIWTFRKIQQVYRWLDAGARGLPPDAGGIWGDISDQLYRLQKRSLRSQQSLKSLAERVQKITGALDDGILILDKSRALVWWNPAAEQLLSLQPADRSQAIMNLVRDPAFVSFVQQQDFDLPLEIRAPGNAAKTLLFNAASFGEGEVVLVAHDVTHLRRLEEMRKDFVANISHELRTPLTVISGYLENLEDITEDLPGPFHRALDQMRQQTARMSNLADDLVMLSRLESLDQKAGKAPVALNPMLQQIIADAHALSEGKHEIVFQPGADTCVPGDANQIQSAISNLVFNAVRHNAAGVTITVSVTKSDDSIDVSVSDNGIGIDPVHLPRLTERFYRVDSSRATSSGGTGLGLAIVKHVLLRHNASLDIQSTLGKGSTFTCHFPAVDGKRLETGG